MSFNRTNVASGGIDKEIIIQAANQAVRNCALQIKRSVTSDQALLKELKEYLELRKKHVDVELYKRAIFINTLIELIRDGKTTRLSNHLRESNIAPFKGLFSKRLYNILAKIRESLQENSLEMEEHRPTQRRNSLRRSL